RAGGGGQGLRPLHAPGAPGGRRGGGAGGLHGGGAYPAAACRPFSADRKGLVLAEGAAVFVLESLDAARRRNAPILGELTGFGITSDAGHVTDPSPDGAARAMAMALHDGSHDPGDVDYIN